MNDEVIVNTLFDKLLKSCEKICKESSDFEKIKETFIFARNAHSGVRRKSGEPYITHPLSVALIVVDEMGLGVKSVQASLLHDVVEDTDYTLEDISFRFGEKVASMVDGLTKLSGVFDNNSSEQAENFKRMLLTLSDDVRVILIKIADRLHNMRTLGSMLPHKQMKIASETIYLFAPLAHRLGLYAIKSELEDLSLKFRFAEQYAEIEEKLEDTKLKRDEFIENLCAPIRKKLEGANIDFTIAARVKSIYSIWKKIKAKQIDFSEIYDIFAVRIVFKPKEGLSEKTQCWHIYSLLTDLYLPKMDRIRDWLGSPKANGYEALHCTLMGPGGIWAEVQIRSERMNDIAERGFAAHWSYKQKNSKADEEIDPLIEQLRHALNRPTEDAVEFLDNFKLGLQVSEIMVFTPKGESKTMPRGSTALDFAYEIHSKVGSCAIGAKINYKLTSIYAEINSGDQIEIITSSSVIPQAEWLDHVKTAKAKFHIKQALKGDTQKNIEKGMQLFEDRMQELNTPIQARVFKKILPAYKLSNKQAFYIKVGSGQIDLSNLESVLKSNAAQKLIKYWSLQLSRSFRTTKHTEVNSQEMILAKCCKPIAGDEVVGFETDNGKVEVHRRSCPVAVRLSAQHGDRIVPAKWSSEKILSYLATIEVRGIDRVGILLDVSKIISEQLDVNIRAVDFASHDGIFEGKITLYVQNNGDLKDIMAQVASIKGIDKIHRVEGDTIN
ncbi:MAG: RelA/SpoT family protein [Rikenellaceae bacterium]